MFSLVSTVNNCRPSHVIDVISSTFHKYTSNIVQSIVQSTVSKIIDVYLKSKGITIQVKDCALHVSSDKPLVISSNLLVLMSDSLHLNPVVQDEVQDIDSLEALDNVLINITKGNKDGLEFCTCTPSDNCSCE